MSSLDESNCVHNNQLAFSILEKELGIPPVMSPNSLANTDHIDKLTMVLYLTQIQSGFALPKKGESFRIKKSINPHSYTHTHTYKTMTFIIYANIKKVKFNQCICKIPQSIERLFKYKLIFYKYIYIYICSIY